MSSPTSDDRKSPKISEMIQSLTTLAVCLPLLNIRGILPLQVARHSQKLHSLPLFGEQFSTRVVTKSRFDWLPTKCKLMGP